MFCKFCGTEIEDTSTFCRKCGKELSAITKEDNIPKKDKRISKKKLIIGAIILTCGLMGVIIFNYMVGVTVVSTNVEAGSVVTTKDFIKAKSSNATIKVNGKINTDVLGENVLICNVENGIFKANKKVKVLVVDTSAPIIVGPESITMIKGDEFDPEDYYKIEDFDKGLENKMEVIPDIDTSIEGCKEVKIQVYDSSGNKGELDIRVNVLSLSRDEEIVLKAVNQYIADGNDKNSVLSSAWIMKTSGGTNGVDYYVKIANNVLYAIYSSGKVAEYTISDSGGSTMHDLLIYAVQYNGKTISTSKFVD